MWIFFSLFVSFAFPLPLQFDVRTQWKHCQFTILNQESCGSSWSISATGSFSDRLCITGDAPSGTIISPEPILECSPKYGCNGGTPSAAWDWMTKRSVTICTNQCFGGCVPYYCGSGVCPACHRGMCHNGKLWSTVYTPTSFQRLPIGDLQLFQEEILKNGPLEACFLVTSNFFDFFRSNPHGIYTSSSGPLIGGHCVKMMGWGTENEIDYWLLANSWDTNWGENGYFKMQRGTNLCGIESYVTQGFTSRQVPTLSPVAHFNSTIYGGGWREFNSQELESEIVGTSISAIFNILKDNFNLTYVHLKTIAVQVQVVAGIHFLMVLQVKEGFLKVLLYRSLDNEYKVIQYRLQQ
jgi:cathepsin B